MHRRTIDMMSVQQAGFSVKMYVYISRLLAVTGFSSNVMADISVPMRFENFSYATSFIGAKNPGIRIEMLDKQRTEKRKPQVSVYAA